MHDNNKVLETDRLILRRFSSNDAQDMYKNWISDPLVQKEYGEPIYESLEDVQELIGLWIKQYGEDYLYRWAVIQKDAGECIGQVAFCKNYTEHKTVEAEYCIGTNFWGKGYATEALKAVIEHTFECTSYETIEAYVREENRKSERVLIKAGMKKVQSIKRFEMEAVSPEGKICYAVTRK